MGVLFAFCPSLRNKCLILSQQARTRLKQCSIDKVFDESHLKECGILAKDRVPMSVEVRNLHHLYQTRRVGEDEKEARIRSEELQRIQFASGLFKGYGHPEAKFDAHGNLYDL